MRRCTRCKQYYYDISFKGTYGLLKTCDICRTICGKQARQYNKDNKERIAERNKNITPERRKKYNASRRRYYQHNKERIKAYQRSRYVKKRNPVKNEVKPIKFNGLIEIY